MEVLSPSNTASQINRYARLCLANGAEEFWTVDPDTATLSVRQKGSSLLREYERDQVIQLGAFMGSGTINASDLFAGIA